MEFWVGLLGSSGWHLQCRRYFMRMFNIWAHTMVMAILLYVAWTAMHKYAIFVLRSHFSIADKIHNVERYLSARTKLIFTSQKKFLRAKLHPPSNPSLTVESNLPSDYKDYPALNQHLEKMHTDAHLHDRWIMQQLEQHKDTQHEWKYPGSLILLLLVWLIVVDVLLCYMDLYSMYMG